MNTIARLSDLAAYLKKVAATFSQHNYEQLYHKLRARYEQQVMEAFMDRYPGWSVVEGNAACMMYLYRNRSFSRRLEENATHLSALADDITENYDDCDDKFLTAEATVETMKVAERVYDFSGVSQSLCKTIL